MWVEEELSDLDFAQDVEFDRATARELYRSSFDDPNLSARWQRIHEEVQFVDIVEATHGRADSNGMISCPFHGRDRTASFKLYKGSNDAYCFGCPEGQKYYDSVRFVAAKFGYTPLQAIKWIEREYELPELEIEEADEDIDASGFKVVSLNFTHMAPLYIDHAAKDFRQQLDPELAREYISIFFEAKPGRKADPGSEEELTKATALARVLGWKALEALKKRVLR